MDDTSLGACFYEHFYILGKITVLQSLKQFAERRQTFHDIEY